MTIRVVVADDHPVFRSGLRAMVEDADDLSFVGEACDGEEALALCRAAPPDVVLMDLRMPGTSGVAATAALRAELPDVQVVMLTMLEDDTSLVAALRAGARGYVLKGPRRTRSCGRFAAPQPGKRSSISVLPIGSSGWRRATATTAPTRSRAKPA